MSAATLKKLQSDLLKAKKKITELNAKQRQLSLKMTEAVKDRDIIQSMIRKQTSNIVLSEHAMLRFLERYRGLDLDLLANEILPIEDEIAVKKRGDCTYVVPVRNKKPHRIVVKKNVVVTVE
jgi:hypothetical protein